MNKQKRYRISILFFFISVSFFAQTKKDTLKILFVGNSYTYYHDMPKMVSKISSHTKTKLITEMSAPGGARLRGHWLGLHGMKTKEIIKKGEFDIVVLQGQSMAALKRPDTLKKYSKLFSDFIKKHKAKPYFYLTWAREKTPERQKDITKVFTEIATTNNATLVSVGWAWSLVRKSRNDIKLYARDGSHPNKLGAYLTASVFVATISGELPLKVTQSILPINTNDALFCKRIASGFISKK